MSLFISSVDKFRYQKSLSQFQTPISVLKVSFFVLRTNFCTKCLYFSTECQFFVPKVSFLLSNTYFCTKCPFFPFSRPISVVTVPFLVLKSNFYAKSPFSSSGDQAFYQKYRCLFWGPILCSKSPFFQFWKPIFVPNVSFLVLKSNFYLFLVMTTMFFTKIHLFLYQKLFVWILQLEFRLSPLMLSKK